MLRNVQFIPTYYLSNLYSFLNTQNEIEILKAENDRLKSSGNATPTATPVKTARPPSETSSTSSSSSRQSLGLSLNNLNITDTIMSGQFSVSTDVCMLVPLRCLCVSARCSELGEWEWRKVDFISWSTHQSTGQSELWIHYMPLTYFWKKTNADINLELLYCKGISSD